MNVRAAPSPPDQVNGQQAYRRRKLTERAHGIIKNRGMARFLVHGREKVRAVCLLHALALNLGWAHTLSGAVLRLPRHWRPRQSHDGNRIRKRWPAQCEARAIALQSVSTYLLLPPDTYPDTLSS